jgi:glycosyltransferase involved in cell wall biosynthesis
VRADGRLDVVHVITRMIVGGAQETVLLAASLADRTRFHPVVVTGTQTGSEGSLHEELARRGVDVVLVPNLVRQVSPVTDARAMRALTNVLRDLRPDVVHTNSSKAGALGRLAARRAAVPRVIHTVHGWPFHEHQRPPVAAAWRVIERRAAPLADRLVVVADADRAKGLAARIGRPEQYLTVRSGLELALYRRDAGMRSEVRSELGLPLDALVVGAVNRLSRQKDPETLLRAAAVALRADPRTRLLIVGDGPLRGDVEALVQQLGLQSRVRMIGLRSDVPRLLTAMDVFVSASRWEGLPRTIVQAMAARVPVVATAADGIVDVVADGLTGRLVPVGDAAALGQAVADVLVHPRLGAALADAAAQRLPEFDAVRMVRELEQLYAGGP